MVILEGWCIGFRALGEEELERRWRDAVREREEEGEGYRGRLGYSRFEDVRFINEALRGYDALTGLDFLSCAILLPLLSSIFEQVSDYMTCALQSARRVDPHVRPQSQPPNSIPTHSTDLPPTSDAADMHDVYAWRQEQEAALRATKGMGMSNEQVVKFVDGCMSPNFPPFSLYHSQTPRDRKNGQ